MKKTNEKKIETLLLYCTQREVAEMLNMTQWEFLEKLSNDSFTPADEKVISKIKPMKQIVLILSSQFMKEHPRSGERTNFKEQIEIGLGMYERMSYFPEPGKSVEVDTAKVHTIRAKYNEWVEKIAEVNRGEAFLRVVTWSGTPYRSPWVDVAVLTKDSGIGVQALNPNNEMCFWYIPLTDDFKGISKPIYVKEIAKNDGLQYDDFKAWFKGYDLSEPMALIHFTKFRY